MATVLLLGAGFTRAARPNAPRSQRPPLDGDFFSVAQAVDSSEFRKLHDFLQEFVGEYAETLISSLETTTTYLYLKALDSKPGDQFHTAFLRSLALLNKVLAESTNPLKTGPRSLVYRFFLSELRKCNSPADLTVITFNYDLLIERTLQELQQTRLDKVFTFPGCYRLPDIAKNRVVGVNSETPIADVDLAHSGIAVLKLHGSMNWFSAHTSDQPNPSALFNNKRQLYIANSKRIRPKLQWRRNKRLVYVKPVIVPPITGKRTILHQDVIPLWSLAAAALRQATRVIIAGYSCPPLDIETRILLSENLQKNKAKKVYVIDPNPESAAKFSRICDVDHITIYDSIADWVRDGTR